MDKERVAEMHNKFRYSDMHDYEEHILFIQSELKRSPSVKAQF